MCPSAIDPEPPLTARDLSAVIDLVYARSGIRLHEGKRALVLARLQRRVRAGGFRSFGEYLRYVDADATGVEVGALLDAIATNHTQFYREEQHFTFLRERVVPDLLSRPAGSLIRVWSAACATGEEPFSIAMTLFDALPPPLHAQVRVLASDLSGRALSVARAGVYRIERTSALPEDMRRRYLERGAGGHLGLARVKDAVRRAVEFRRINLMDAGSLPGPFVVIFCRNAMIYFDTPARQRVVRVLEERLPHGGYLFVSHSESLNGLSHGLQWIAPAVYRRMLPGGPDDAGAFTREGQS